MDTRKTKKLLFTITALLLMGLGLSPAMADDGDSPEELGGPRIRPLPMPGDVIRGMPGPQPPTVPIPDNGDPEDEGGGGGSGDYDDEGSSGTKGGSTTSTGGFHSDDNRQKPPTLDPNAKVAVDFVDAEVMDIIRYMAEITGRNFILGEKLSGKITIISHKKVSVAEAYEAFISALEVAGYTTVTVGQATKVVKTGDAAKTPLRVYSGGTVPYTDNFVTQIIQLENVSVKDISAIVKELASSSGRVIAYQPTNTLIITDSATNIRRVHMIITELDVAAPKSKLEIIPLRYATASDVVTILKEIYGVEASSSAEDPATAARTARTARNRRARNQTVVEETSATSVGGEGSYISKIISDERTNSLIVQANEDAIAAILDLVSRLDVDVDPSSRSQIHVVYLEHAKAEDVAQVLSNLAGSSTASTSRTSSSRTSNTNNRNMPRMPGPMPGGEVSTGGDVKTAGAVAAFDSGMRVASDENTNSLVIIAAPEEFRIINQVISKLDIRRKQVFVEAVILEMAIDETDEFGVGYHTGVPSDDGGYSAYSAQLNGSSLGLSMTDVLSGLAMGVFGQNIEIPIMDANGETSMVSVPGFGIALNALQSNSSVNIVSTPNVLTMDNEEAKFVVGRNIPFPISTGRDSNNNPIVSYQREDVAITLRVTPQINESDFVTLQVFQEVQEIEEDSQGLDVNSAGFITSKRSAETTVVVQDNQTVVIGGLIGNTETNVETKIPVLGDLPLIGRLFRGTRTSARKTNLLIFLTPHVISDPEDLEEVYRVKVAQRQAFIERFYGRSVEEQEAEMMSLLRYSMNVVDEPSVYRTKQHVDTNVSTIGDLPGEPPKKGGEVIIEDEDKLEDNIDEETGPSLEQGE